VWHVGGSFKASYCDFYTSAANATIDIYNDVNPPAFYACTIINAGAGETVSDSGGGGQNVNMVHCRLKHVIGATVTNLIVDGHNVVDANLEEI